MKAVEIYTDGACSGNPGPGGWAAILRYGSREKVLSGGEAETTNNRMELTAAIRGLKALREPCAVTLYSDSRYLVDAVNRGWARGWRERGWMRTKKEPAKNPELWQELLELLDRHQTEIRWVKGHADDAMNARCDALAVAESRKFADPDKV
ncbi:MAG: ribonuclease HI [Oscillospiraceae bacterium]|nr:ribonuclease HI [Oscillospiraceae bacterium]